MGHRYDVSTDPEKMTPRARAYLIVTSLEHLGFAYCCIVIPSTFRSSSFLPIISAAPLWFWGVIFAGACLASGAGALTQRAGLARLGMTWSAVSTVMIAAGLVIAFATGQLSAPTGPIVWGALAAKDFIVCAQPMRSPFEALMAQIDRRRAGRGVE